MKRAFKKYMDEQIKRSIRLLKINFVRMRYSYYILILIILSSCTKFGNFELEQKGVPHINNRVSFLSFEGNGLYITESRTLYNTLYFFDLEKKEWKSIEEKNKIPNISAFNYIEKAFAVDSDKIILFTSRKSIYEFSLVTQIWTEIKNASNSLNILKIPFQNSFNKKIYTTDYDNNLYELDQNYNFREIGHLNNFFTFYQFIDDDTLLCFNKLYLNKENLLYKYNIQDQSSISGSFFIDQQFSPEHSLVYTADNIIIPVIEDVPDSFYQKTSRYDLFKIYKNEEITFWKLDLQTLKIQTHQYFSFKDKTYLPKENWLGNQCFFTIQSDIWYINNTLYFFSNGNDYYFTESDDQWHLLPEHGY